MESAKLVIGEKYSLRWNSYKNSLVHHLSDHLAHEEHVDVTLACEGKYIKAHKLILSSCSPYFRELFRIHKVDNPLIFLNSVKYMQLKNVIDFVYNGEIQVAESELEDVLTLGTNLQIKGLSNARSKKYEDNNEILRGNSPSVEKLDTYTDNNKLVDELKPVRKFKRKLDSPELPSKKSNLSSKTRNKKANSSRNSAMREVMESSEESGNTVDELDQSTIRNIIGVSSESRIDMKKMEPFQIPQNSTAHELNYGANYIHLAGPSQPVLPVDTVTILPPKRVSAFMIFANDWRKRLVVEHPDESNKQISLRLSNMWKSLSEETKDTFYEEARIANEEQNQKSVNKTL